MPQVEWDGSLANGVALINTQHKELFRIINSFSDRIGQEEDTFTLAMVLDSLKNYVHYHFASEEKLLLKNDCHDLARHESAHAAFANLVASYEKRRKTIDGEGLLELQKFLVEWLVSHIQKEDIPLRAYMAP